MSDYSVRAVLSAVDNGFTEAFQRAARSVENLKNVTGNFSPGVVESMKNPTDAAFKYENNISRVAGTVGKALTGIGKKATIGMSIPLIAGFKKAVSTGVEFDGQMQRVKAISGATGNQFDSLRKQAIDLGAQTIFTARDVGTAQEMFASQGYSVQDMLKAMPGVMDLAAVSGKDMGLAAEAAGAAIRQFGLDTKDTAHIADVYAKTAADTNAETRDLATAMSYAGPVAGNLGVSVEQTAAAIGIMSNAGIKGSKAGMTLRTALTRLASPTEQARDLMKKLGFSAFDSQGQMKPMGQIVRELQTSFSGLSQEQKQQALDTIFGKNAMSGMLSLINSAPGEFDALTQSLTESDGAASKMADTINAGLPGAIEEMKGALETAGITIKDILEDRLESAANTIANLARKFIELPEPIQGMIVNIGLAAAAFGPLMLVFGALGKAISGAITSFGAFKTGLSMVGQGASLASASTGGFSGVLGGLAGKIAGAAGAMAPWLLALAAVAIALKLAWEHSETFRDTVGNVFNEISTAAGEFGGIVKEAFGQLKEAFAPVLDALKELGRVIGESLGPVFSTVAQIIGAVVVGAFKLLGSAVKLIVSILTPLAPMIEGIISVASGLAQIVGAVLGPAITIAGGIIKGVIGIFIALGQAILDVGTAIMDKLAPVFDFVGQVLGKVGEVCSGVGEKIGGFMEKIGLGAEQTTTSFQAMDESTSMSFDNMLNKSNESTTGILGAFDLLSTGSIEKSSEMNMQLAQLFEQMGGQLPAKTQDMAYKIVQAMTEMGVGSIQEANALVQGVGVKWEEMSSWTDREWNQVADIVRTKMAETQANASKESSRISKDINTDWSSINTDTNKTWTDIQSTISQEMGTSNTNAVNEAGQINTGVSKEFDSMKTTVQTTMDGISSSVQTGMSTVSNQIKTDLSGVSNAFKTQLSAISSQVKSSMDQMGQGIKTSMTTATTTVSQSLKQIQQGITQAMTAIKTAVKQGMTQVVKEVQNGCKKAVEEVNSKKSAMQSAGRNLSAGLASGIRSGRSAVISAAASVAQAAIQAAKSKLSIHSPSKVFKQIGAYTMEGMEIGILKNGRDPVRAVEDTAKKIANVPFATQLDGMYQSLNKDITKSFKLSMPEKQPMSLTLHLGRHAYKTFVEDITDLQDQEARLEEAYSF